MYIRSRPQISGRMARISSIPAAGCTDDLSLFSREDDATGLSPPVDDRRTACTLRVEIKETVDAFMVRTYTYT